MTNDVYTWFGIWAVIALSILVCILVCTQIVMARHDKKFLGKNRELHKRQGRFTDPFDNG